MVLFLILINFFSLLYSSFGMFGSGDDRPDMDKELRYKKNIEIRVQQQRSVTEDGYKNSSSDSWSSGIAFSKELDDADDNSNNIVNTFSIPFTPSVTMEDCREALKKYPNHERLVLKKNEQTGKISLVGASIGSFALDLFSGEEAEANRAALQAVRNLIAEHIRCYGQPSSEYVNYEPHLFHLMEFGEPLDSETLRRILYHTTGTIHGAEGNYEYQACLGDPERNDGGKILTNFTHPNEIYNISSRVETGVKLAAKMVSIARNSISSVQGQNRNPCEDTFPDSEERIPFAKFSDKKSYGTN